MTFSTLASPGVSLQGGGGSGGGGGGTPGGSNTQIQYNSSGTFAGASGLTTNGTELTVASGTQTADAPVLNMSQTWNNAAVTFTGIKFNATDTASAAASLLMDLQVGGSSRFNVGKTGSLKLGVNPTGTNQAGTNVTIAGSQGTGTGAGGSIVFQVAPAGSSGTAQNGLATALTINADRSATFAAGITAGSSSYVSAGGISLGAVGLWQPINGNLTLLDTAVLGWSSTTNVNTGNPGDVRLYRDAANTLALRNGASAQTFRVYNTTDGTNSEFFGIIWSSNRAILTTATAGTGVTNRDLYLQNDQASQNVFCAAPFKFSLDNTYDIGASGATRPRNVYVANAVTAVGLISTNGDFRAGSANYFYWNSRSQMSSPADGNILLQNIAATDFGRLQFGGTTSSFPAIKRSSTTLQARLADDSAFAGFASANMQAATAYTVATLPGTPGTGMIARVTDALAPTIGATVTGGGAAYALVNYNGANWTVIGV